MTTARDRRERTRAVLADFNRERPPQREADVPPPSSPRTGPGLLLQGVAVNTGLQSKIEQLEGQLADFEGAAPARLIDADLVDDSEFANRHPDAFKSQAFLQLKEEIASAGRNVQPIKVRRKANGRFEIIFGHRRARACKELGLPVLALIVDDMTDVALIIEMDRENRGRTDPSAWEQGMFYLRALERGLFPSQRQLAHQLNVDVSNAGKAIALAKLPSTIIGAFSSPLDIQLRWGGALAKAFETDKEGVLARAAEIAASSPRPRASIVFQRLCGTLKATQTQPTEVEIAVGDKRFGKLEMRDNKATVQFDAGVLDAKSAASFAEMVAKWLSSRSRK